MSTVHLPDFGTLIESLRLPSDISKDFNDRPAILRKPTPPDQLVAVNSGLSAKQDSKPHVIHDESRQLEADQDSAVNTSKRRRSHDQPRPRHPRPKVEKELRPCKRLRRCRDDLINLHRSLDPQNVQAGIRIKHQSPATILLRDSSQVTGIIHDSFLKVNHFSVLPLNVILRWIAAPAMICPSQEAVLCALVALFSSATRNVDVDTLTDSLVHRALDISDFARVPNQALLTLHVRLVLGLTALLRQKKDAALVLLDNIPPYRVDGKCDSPYPLNEAEFKDCLTRTQVITHSLAVFKAMMPLVTTSPAWFEEPARKELHDVAGEDNNSSLLFDCDLKAVAPIACGGECDSTVLHQYLDLCWLFLRLVTCLRHARFSNCLAAEQFLTIEHLMASWKSRRSISTRSCAPARTLLHQWYDMQTTFLYHYCMVVLYRYKSSHDPTADGICPQAVELHGHAIEILKVATIFVTKPCCSDTIPNLFIAHAILFAIDIVTARGMIHDFVGCQQATLTYLYGGLEALCEIAMVWPLVWEVYARARARCEQMYMYASRAAMQGQTAFCFKKPIICATPVEMDLVYCMEPKRYLEALGKDMTSRSERDIFCFI